MEGLMNKISMINLKYKYFCKVRITSHFIAETEFLNPLIISLQNYFLRYAIDIFPDMPCSDLSDRTRRISVLNSNFLPVEDYYYYEGIGIYSMRLRRENIYITEFAPELKIYIEECIRKIDEFVFSSIPELRKLLEEIKPFSEF